CLLPDHFQAQWPDQPHRFPVHEPFNILAAKVRYVVAKLLAKELDKASPVTGFLDPHVVEERRRGRKILTKTVREIGVDPLVILFQSYGESQNLTFGKAVEIAHNEVQYSDRKRGATAWGLHLRQVRADGAVHASAERHAAPDQQPLHHSEILSVENIRL